MKVKILVIFSFLMVGVILLTNEPPIYSKEKIKEYPIETYDISHIRADILNNVATIRQEREKLNKGFKSLKKENKELRKEVDSLKELITDTVSKTDTVFVKRKTFFERLLKK